MSKEDVYAFCFNFSSSTISNTRIPILFPEDYEVLDSYFEDYILGIEKNGSYIWKSITKGSHK